MYSFSELHLIKKNLFIILHRSYPNLALYHYVGGKDKTKELDKKNYKYEDNVTLLLGEGLYKIILSTIKPTNESTRELNM